MGPHFDLKTCTWLAGYLPSTPLGEAPLKSLCSWNWPSPQPPCSDAGHRHPLLCQHSPPGDYIIEKEWLTLIASEPTFLAFKVSPDASRQFSVLPLLFSYFVRMLMENLKSPIKLHLFEKRLLGNERAGIFGHSERVVVPCFLRHIEDAGNKGLQPTRHLAKSKHCKNL